MLLTAAKPPATKLLRKKRVRKDLQTMPVKVRMQKKLPVRKAARKLHPRLMQLKLTPPHRMAPNQLVQNP
jgi:hypothetical protein